MEKILFVEDNKVDVDDAMSWFKKRRYEVRIATNVAEAEQALNGEQYKLIVLDMHLPVGAKNISIPHSDIGGGIYILRKIQNGISNPVIIFSGFEPRMIEQELKKYNLQVPEEIRNKRTTSTDELIDLIKQFLSDQ